MQGKGPSATSLPGLTIHPGWADINPTGLSTTPLMCLHEAATHVGVSPPIALSQA